MSESADWAERILNYRFTDENLLAQALTHRSAGGYHNERLEFLGDAVLDLVVAEALYDARPQAREGVLSRYRSLLVRRETLAELGRELGLGERLSMGSGELRTGSFQRRSVLADALEAVVGAIYLDGGFPAAAAVVMRLFQARLANLPPESDLIDAKTALQELLQARGLATPDYELIDASGPDHAQIFRCACRVSELAIEGQGEARSRRHAEQAAAAQVLAQLADVS